MTTGTGIDTSATDALSVAPADESQGFAHDPRQEAGQDKSIAKRLEKNPTSADARLDAGLDQSMDASDPPSSTQPVHATQPPASSGYDPEAERKLADGKA